MVRPSRWRNRRVPLVASALLLVLAAVALQVPRSDAAFLGATGNTGTSWGASSDFVSGSLQRWGFETLAPATPTRFGTGTWSAVASAEDHTCAIKASDGTLWCWGYNSRGQLGQGRADDTEMWFGPVKVGTSAYTAVASGHDYSCAIRSTGIMYCWGRNNNGQLGVGDTVDRHAPTAVIGGSTAWTDVQAGENTVCAVRSATRTLYCWGVNSNGALGQGDTTMRSSPTQVPGTTWNRVSVYWAHTCATRTDGTLWCWGWGGEGQLGQGADLGDKNVPTQVTGTGWVTPAAGGATSCATRSNYTLYCWGRNGGGQVGVGDTTQRTSPALLTGSWNTAALSLNNGAACAIRTTGTLWCWGSNGNQELGVSDTAVHDTPVQTSSATTWTEVSASIHGGCARRSDNSLWCWGGMHATGAFAHPVQSPGQVGGLTSWRSVGVGHHEVCAIRNDGTLWCVGYNDRGQLGQNDRIGRAVLDQVGTATNWATVAAGNGHVCATRTDATLWCWGGNWIGQLGNGNSTDQYLPVQIDSANRYVSVVAGEGATCAIRTTTYNLYCWGWNDQGQVGTGNTTHFITPQLVGGSVAWSKVAMARKHTCAVRRTTGALYCWGMNTSGQLGNGTTTGSTAPILVDSGNAYSDVGVSLYSTCGIRTTGSLYCWGDNDAGQLGLGTTTQRSTPTRVGLGTTWYSLATGFFYACAAQVDRSVWCWGSNATGQLGQGDLTDVSSPVRVPGVLSRTVTAGKAAAYAIDLS